MMVDVRSLSAVALGVRRLKCRVFGHVPRRAASVRIVGRLLVCERCGAIVIEQEW